MSTSLLAVLYFVLTTCIVCIYYHTELLELFNVPVVITVICETLTKSLRSSHPRPPAPITRILHVSWINFRLWKKKSHFKICLDFIGIQYQCILCQNVGMCKYQYFDYKQKLKIKFRHKWIIKVWFYELFSCCEVQSL